MGRFVHLQSGYQTSFLPNHIHLLHLDRYSHPRKTCVLEWGAGAEWPDIILAKTRDDVRVVLSDYPDRQLIDALIQNVTSNTTDSTHVVPYDWTTNNIAPFHTLSPGGFDVIIAADGSEPVLGALRQAADYAGIPYTLYVASKTPGGFTPALLSNGGTHAYYQGIVLTTGSLGYQNGTTWTSAFSPSEWQTLWDYQAKYRVRTAIAYAYPTADLGYGLATGVDATTNPIPARLTSSGQSVFPYVNATNPIRIEMKVRGRP